MKQQEVITNKGKRLPLELPYATYVQTGVIRKEDYAAIFDAIAGIPGTTEIIDVARQAITLTTLGTGAATYDPFTGVLNIPIDTTNTGTVTSIGTSIDGSALFINNSNTPSPISTSGSFDFLWQGNSAQYVTGSGALALFPTNVSAFTNDALYITSSSFNIGNSAGVSQFAVSSNQMLQFAGTNGISAVFDSVNRRVTLDGLNVVAIKSLGVSGSYQTGSQQTLATGSSGTDFNITSSGNTHTFNIPSASSTTVSRGLVTNTNQVFAGNKIFENNLLVDGNFFVNSGTITMYSVPFSTNSISLVGSSAFWTRSLFTGSSTSFLTNGSSHATAVFKDYTITKPSSGSATLLAHIAVQKFTGGTGAGTIDNSAGIYVQAASTLATNNYAIWVDDGTTRLDGELELHGISSVATSYMLFYNTSNKRVTYQSASTSNISEGSNLYYTDSRSRLAISLTTLGSGAATYNNTTGVLNIPTFVEQYLGTVTSVGASIGGTAIAISGSPVTSSGTIAFSFQGTSAQYISGEGNLVAFPTIPTYTANNGLTMSSYHTVLGGDLLYNTHLTQAFNLSVDDGTLSVGAGDTVGGARVYAIKGTAQTGQALYAVKNTTVSGSDFGSTASFQRGIASTSFASTVTQTGVYGQIELQGAGFAFSGGGYTPLAGVTGTFTIGNNTGTFSSGSSVFSGLYGYINIGGSGTIDKVAAVRASIPVRNPNINNFTGTITNYYGVYIDDQSTGLYAGNTTNRYGIYQAGAGETNLFNGFIKLPNISDATGDFVTVDSNKILRYRTAAEVLTDLGGLSTTVAASTYVPYTGAIGAVNLGTNAFSAGATTLSGLLTLSPSATRNVYVTTRTFNSKEWSEIVSTNAAGSTVQPFNLYGSEFNFSAATAGSTALAISSTGTTVSGTFGVTGATTLSSTLSVTGTVTTSSTLTIGTIGALGSAATVFLTHTSGLIQSRAASQVLSDIGAVATTSLVGVTNYLARWTSASTLGTGATTDNGTEVGMGTTPVSGIRLTIAGDATANNLIVGTSNSNGSVRISASNSTSPQLNFQNSSGTKHWTLYETLGAAGQQGSFNIYDNVAAITPLSFATTTGAATFYGTVTAGVASGSAVLGSTTTNTPALSLYGYFTNFVAGGAINIINRNHDATNALLTLGSTAYPISVFNVGTQTFYVTAAGAIVTPSSASIGTTASIGGASVGTASYGEADVLIVKGAGTGVGLITSYRAASNVNYGTGFSMALQNASGTRVDYGAIFSTIKTNTAGAEYGTTGFYNIIAGATTEQFRIDNYFYSFGGQTSSFPALKRSSATLQVRLADDSGYAALSTGALTTSSTLTVGSIAALGTAGTTFLTHTSGLVQSRTAAQVLSDISAVPLAALSGTSNYLARWTGTTTLGIGLHQDNGTATSIGGGINSSYLQSTWGRVKIGNTSFHANVDANTNFNLIVSTALGAFQAATGKGIYLYNDGTTLKLDAYDYATSASLNFKIGGNGGNVTVDAPSLTVTGTSTFNAGVNISYTSPALSLINAGSSNKAWAFIMSGNDLQIRETGVDFPMTFKAGGTILINTVATSSGTYDLLTRNTSTLAIEKISSSTFALATGGTGYIQNQYTASQTSSEFWVSGRGRVDGVLSTGMIHGGTATNFYMGYGRAISWNSTGTSYNGNASIYGDTGDIIVYAASAHKLLSGNVLIGSSTNDGVNSLQVTGNTKLTGTLQTTGNAAIGGSVGTIDALTVYQSSTTANATGLFVNATGANTSGTVYAGYFNKVAGAGGTGVAGYFNASGGTNNYAIQVASGDVRLNSLANASGDFVTYATGSVLRSRTAAQVLSDIGGLSTSVAAATYVPYEGATGSLNLGVNGLTALSVGVTNMFTTNAYVSGLTSGRVVYSSTSGQLVASDNFTYNGSLATIKSARNTTYQNAILVVNDTTAYATGVGGSIHFGGKYNSAGDYAGAGSIWASKENATDGNYAFSLNFGSRANGGSSITANMTINSAGEVSIGGTAVSGRSLTVAGSARVQTRLEVMGTTPFIVLQDGVNASGTIKQNATTTEFRSNDNTVLSAAFNQSGNWTFSENATISKNQNAATLLTIHNGASGTAGYAGVQLGNSNSTNAGGIAILSASYTPSGVLRSDSMYVYSTRAGGIVMRAEHASGTIGLSAGGSTTDQFTINASGNIIIPGFSNANSLISFRTDFPDGTNVGIRAKDVRGGGFRDGMEIMGQGINFSINNAADTVFRITGAGDVLGSGRIVIPALDTDLTAPVNSGTVGFVTTDASGRLSWVAAGNYLTTATAAATYVPYTGATGAVNLGSNILSAGQVVISKAGGVAGSSSGLYLNYTSSYGGISINTVASNNTFVEFLEAGTKKGSIEYQASASKFYFTSEVDWYWTNVAGTTRAVLTTGSNFLLGAGSAITNSANITSTVRSASSDARIILQNNVSGSTLTDGLQIILSGVDGYLHNHENGDLYLGTNNVSRWGVSAAGKFLALAHNTYDIGTSMIAAAPRTIYAGTSVVSPVGTFSTSLTVGVANTSGQTVLNHVQYGGANNVSTGFGTQFGTATFTRERGPTGTGISGAIYASQYFTVGSGSLEIYTADAIPLVLGTNATARLTISSTGISSFSGNVGINITNPSQKFVIQETAGIATSMANFTNGTDANVQIHVTAPAAGTKGALIMPTTGSTYLGLGSSNVERWRIDASGHLVPIADASYDIGSSSATAKDLYIRNTSFIQFGTSYGTGTLTFRNGATSIGGWDVANAKFVNNLGTYYTASGAAGKFGTQDNFNIELHTNSVARVTISSTGTSIAGTLTVADNATFSGNNVFVSGKITQSGTGGSNQYYSASGATFALGSGNSNFSILAGTVAVSTNTTYGFTGIQVTPTYNATGTYSGTFRGLYYNPTLTSMTGVTHYAIETTAGQVKFVNGSNSFWLDGSYMTVDTVSGHYLQIGGGNKFTVGSSSIVAYNAVTLDSVATSAGSYDILTRNASTKVVERISNIPVSMGGTGASTLTGITIGNGTSAMTAVAGTAGQLLRRNAANTAYEFFTADYAGITSTQISHWESAYGIVLSYPSWDAAYSWVASYGYADYIRSAYISSGTGISVTGSGVFGDPLVISATGGGSDTNYYPDYFAYNSATFNFTIDGPGLGDGLTATLNFGLSDNPPASPTLASAAAWMKILVNGTVRQIPVWAYTAP